MFALDALVVPAVGKRQRRQAQALPVVLRSSLEGVQQVLAMVVPS
jgi:hypothetical protein